MSFPLPPSDNLYKFLAISGVMVFLAAMVSISILVFSSNERAFEYARALGKVGWMEHELEQDMADLRMDIDVLGGVTKQGQATDSQGLIDEEFKRQLEDEKARTEFMDEKFAALNEKFVAIRQKTRSIAPESVDVGIQGAALEHRVQNLKYHAVVLGVFGLIGAIVAVYGFRQWYERVQRYEDMLLKARAEETENTRNRKTIAPTQPKPTPSK